MDAGSGVVEHEVVEDQQARHAGQQIPLEVVGFAVAHLMDDDVEGVQGVDGAEVGRLTEAHRRRQAGRVDVVLSREGLDLVPGREEPKDVGGVVGNARWGWGQRRDECEPHARVHCPGGMTARRLSGWEFMRSRVYREATRA